MTILDQDQRRTYHRERGRTQRALWLAAHPCACSKPSVHMNRRIGAMPRGLWSSGQKTIAKRLAGMVIDYLCGDCQITKTAVNHKIDRQQEYAKQREARITWIASHKCACGTTATIIRGRSGVTRFRSHDQKAIAERLANVVIDYYCDKCWTARKDTARVRHNEQRRTTSSPRELRVQQKRQASKLSARREDNPAPLFSAVHECDCGDRFPRYGLLVRHRRNGCE